MKIVCISDTHCQLSGLKIPDGDVLVHAGDLTFYGEEKEMYPELKFLRDLPHRHKLVIAGNHDIFFEKDNAYARMLMKLYNLTYLEDEEFIIGQTKFYGSPWTPEFGGDAFNISPYHEGEGSLKGRWAVIPPDTDVLITHGPAKGVGDKVRSHNPNTPGYKNVGCYDLAARIKELNLKAHVFGHVHPGYGLYKNHPLSPETLFVNASTCNPKYDPVNEPVVLEI